MPTAQKSKPLITPLARLSYASLFRAKAPAEGAEPRFSCTLIFDEDAQSKPEFAAMRKAAAECAKEKWGDKIPSNLRSPFRDGGEKDQEGYGPGKVFMNVSTKQRPGVVSTQRDPETGKPMQIEEDEIKSGDYVIASLRPYAYDQKGNKGVSFGLQNVQLRKVGEALGFRTAAEDDFDAIDSGEGDSEESADSLF